MKIECHNPSKRDVSPQGFTLIELLVVIGIIAVLAALLLTSIGKAKGKSHRMACLSNLKQWGLAAIIYSDEHDDRLPREKAGTTSFDVSTMNSWPAVSDPVNSDVWYNALPIQITVPSMFDYGRSTERQKDFYSRNLFLCPSARFNFGLTRPMFSLAMCSKLARNGNAPPCLNNAERLSETALFMDSGVPEETQLPGQMNYDGRPHSFAGRFSARHAGYGNIAFCDGGAQSLPAGKVVDSFGGAFFPQSLGSVFWTFDIAADANLKGP
jgi:prepilin-type N-terminal cleavage/methylation domain-containing protein/prepilin-type processing-associated H-X9-DG protein